MASSKLALDLLEENEYCDNCDNSESDIKITLSCNHNLCVPCTQHFVTILLTTTPKPQMVTCPVNQCSFKVEVLQDVIPPYLYREILQINSTPILSQTSENTECCPKCGECGTIEDQECCMEQCLQCEYIFCNICKNDYHGFECKPESNIDIQQSDDEEEDANLFALQLQLQEIEDEDANNVSVKVSCCMCLEDVDFQDTVDYGCAHINSCKSCTKQFFETMIESGDIRGLKCPETGCGTEAPQTLVKDIVDPILYDRLDQLLFVSCLTDLPEIVKCPKSNCQRLLTAEPEFGYCEHCDFRFCTGCNQAFHGATPCGMTEEELKLYMTRYAAADETERIRLENEMKGKRKIENDASEDLIRSIYKKCPTCRTDIEKITGCNKMQCTSCQTFFCYICGAKIIGANPYHHFQGTNCGLFEIPPE